MKRTTDMAVVGAGLAGLSLVDALLERGVEAASLTVIDDADPRRGSSSPATMLHPFPGRKMDLRRGQDEAFVESWRRLGQWSQRLGSDWMKTGAMVRPLSDDERGEMLHDSWQKARSDYPKLIEVELMDAGEVRRTFPGLDPSTPALVYRPAASVMIPELLVRLRAELAKRGVEFVDARMEALESYSGGWSLGLSTGDVVETSRAVLAVGPSLQEYFDGLDLRRKCGEVAVLDPSGEELSALVNASKHIFERPDGLWGLGSTYYRLQEGEERIDGRVIEELKAGVVDIVPAVENAEVVEVWRGDRGVFGSDHMPLVGEVPLSPGLFACAAFGSKGLLWAPAAAEALAGELCSEGDGVSEYMRADRMSSDKWRL